MKARTSKLSPAMRSALLDAEANKNGVPMLAVLVGAHPRTIQALADRRLIKPYGNAGDFQLTKDGWEVRAILAERAEAEARDALVASAPATVDEILDLLSPVPVIEIIEQARAEAAKAQPAVPAGWDKVGTSTEDTPAPMKLGPLDSRPRTNRSPMVATDTRTGQLVEIGDQVTNFRGETGYLTYISRGAVPGKSGKVCVAATPGDTMGAREYYDQVWNLAVSTLRPCGCVITATQDDCTHP